MFVSPFCCPPARPPYCPTWLLYHPLACVTLLPIWSLAQHSHALLPSCCLLSCCLATTDQPLAILLNHSCRPLPSCCYCPCCATVVLAQPLLPSRCCPATSLSYVPSHPYLAQLPFSHPAALFLPSHPFSTQLPLLSAQLPSATCHIMSHGLTQPCLMYHTYIIRYIDII